jgi:hypothetical protein
MMSSPATATKAKAKAAKATATAAATATASAGAHKRRLSKGGAPASPLALPANDDAAERKKANQVAQGENLAPLDNQALAELYATCINMSTQNVRRDAHAPPLFRVSNG